MMPKPVKTKRPLNADRPFPRRCISCGKKSVNMTEIEYNSQFKHDGRTYEFTLPKLAIPVCDSCGEKIFTDEVDRQIIDGLRRHLALLTPHQIQDALVRLGITHTDLANRLGIAEETISAWLNENQIQSQSHDRLMRLFFALPQVRDMLSPDGIDPELGVADELSHLDAQ